MEASGVEASHSSSRGLMARVASAILNTSYSDRPQRNRRRSMSRRAGLMMRSERNCRNWSGVQDVWPWVYRPTVVLKRGSAKRTDKSGTTRPTTSSFHLRYRKAASIGVSFRARTLHYARLSPKSGHPRPKPYPRQKKDPAGRQGREVHGAGDGTRTREYKLGKLGPYHLATPACVKGIIAHLFPFEKKHIFRHG